MNKIFTPKFIFILAIIIVAAILRLVINIPNVTPIAALALIGGTYINRRYLAFALPLIILLATDLIIGFYETQVMLAVYLSFALVVGIGIILRNRVNVRNVVFASLGSSILFFIITNFAVWIGGMVAYPLNFTGLTTCYVAAIPFFKFELAGTLAFNALFFGVFYLAQLRFPVLAKV